MTLVQRPAVPQLVSPPQPMLNGVTIHAEGPTCTCADAELFKMLALMSRGVGQVEASRMLWGDPPPPAPEPLPAPVEPSWSVFLTRWWRA